MPVLLTSDALITSSTSTTSTSLQDCATSMQTSGIATDWFVAYRANFGGNDSSQVGEAICLHDDASVVLGTAAAESNGGGVHYDGGQLQGFARITTSGLDTVKLQHRNITSSDTNYIGSRALMAIPLNQFFTDDGFGGVQSEAATLTENADFFYSGTNSATAENTGIGNTWTTVRTVDFDLVSAGDYYVFFSVETTAAGGSATDGMQARFQIAGTTQCAEFVREWEDDNDRPNFAYSDMVTLSAGTTTFRVQVQNRNANSIVSAYRSRIWAFRVESFLPGAAIVDASGDSAITHTAYSDSEIFLDLPYTTSTRSTNDVGFCTVVMGSSGVNTLAEIRAYNGIGARCVDSGYALNDSGLDSGDDLMPTVLFSVTNDDPTDAAGYKLRTRIGAAGTGTIGRNAGNSAGIRSNMFVWPLFKADIDPMLTDSGLTPTIV